MNTYKRLRNFAPAGKGERHDLDNTVRRMADDLAATPERGRAQLCIIDEKGMYRYCCLEMNGVECGISSERSDHPDLEVITTEETWSKIASGTYSPVEAFMEGKMRVRGDVGFGARILKHLGSEAGKTHC